MMCDPFDDYDDDLSDVFEKVGAVLMGLAALAVVAALWWVARG